MVSGITAAVVIHDKLCTQKGVLCMKKREDCGGDGLQIILPYSLCQIVLASIHEIGHQGHDKTLALLKSRFFWCGMTRDVSDLVKSCAICNMTKPLKKITTVYGHIIANYPLEMVAMDFIEFPRHSCGFKHVLVMTDVFTKYVVAIPTRDQTAHTVADVIQSRWIPDFGIPSKLHSDQGKGFESAVIIALCQKYGIKKSRTSAYNPRGNGICERFNRTLLAMLRSLEDSDKLEWSHHVPHVVLGYNITPHTSTGWSPYYLLYGRHPKLPINFVIEDLFNPDVQGKDDIIFHKRKLAEAHRDASDRIARFHK
uniref:Integrase catalytic domain-containing protein n=1 Tax=Arion vulgaris TaxID=1028688 RepID=A0A0B7BPK8_9EUPU